MFSPPDFSLYVRQLRACCSCDSRAFLRAFTDRVMAAQRPKLFLGVHLWIVLWPRSGRSYFLVVFSGLCYEPMADT